MCKIRLLASAEKELERLDRKTAQRIVHRLRWLAENIDDVPLQALKGSLRGLFKLREGDYRIIFQPLRKEGLIIIHAIGHRGQVYRKK